MSRDWYNIKGSADGSDVTHVHLYDEIGGYGVDAQEFINSLADIKTDSIEVHINSVGGEVFAGFAIYQAIKDHPANVTVTVDALAASIASVIAMAGDKVVMAPNAQMMIHDGQVATAGNAAELTKTVAMLDRVSDNIASVYAERCGGSSGDWRNSMRAESWYNAEEAVAAGLADEVAPKSKRGARNVADLKVFNYAGRDFAPAPVIPAKPETTPEPAPFKWDATSFLDAFKEASE